MLLLMAASRSARSIEFQQPVNAHAVVSFSCCIQNQWVFNVFNVI